MIVEFGDDDGWSPEPGGFRRLRLDAVIHPVREWQEIATLDWWAPPPGAKVTAYLAHRNIPPDAPVIDLEEDGEG